MTIELTDGRRVGLLSYIRWLMFESDIDLLEVWTATVAFLWGLWLTNPAADVFSSAPGFRLMQYVAPEWVWGAIFAVVGACALLARLSRLRRPRYLLALILAAGWVSVMLALALVNWRWLSTVTYSALAASALWVAYRAAAECQDHGG